MKKHELTQKERKFIAVLVKTGDPQYAGEKAGYKGLVKFSACSQLLRRPKIKEEFNRQMQVKLNTASSMALKTMERLAESADSDAVQFQSAKEIARLAGLQNDNVATQQQAINVQINI